jgi:hypothetical protein
VAIDLIPIPVKPDLPPWPAESDEQQAWMQDFIKRHNEFYGILRQDINRLSTPVRAAPVDDDPEIGYALARNSLKDAALILGMNRMQMGLQIANGADRGKVSVSFKYLGVGPLVLGSGASASYVCDLAVSGINGLDTGAEANSTWYYLYVISGDHGPDVTDPTANNEQPPLRRHAAPVATLLSTSATPLLPGGYNRYRRVGMVYNNSAGDLYRFTNAADDDWFFWNEDIVATPFLVLNVTTSAVTFTDVSCAAVVPPTSRLIQMNGQCTDGVTSAIMVRNNDHANITFSATFLAAQVTAYAADTRGSGEFVVGCDASQVVEYRTNATTNDATLCVKAYCDIR